MMDRVSIGLRVPHLALDELGELSIFHRAKLRRPIDTLGVHER